MTSVLVCVTIKASISIVKKEEIQKVEILFRQKSAENTLDKSVLDGFGIQRCILKKISFEKDRSNITRKRHYHTGVEIHIIEEGYQIYEIEGQSVRVDSGQFLLIPTLKEHIALKEDFKTSKYAFTFNLKENCMFARSLQTPSFVVASTPPTVRDNLRYIREESARRAPFCYSVVCGRAWECILQLYRLVGICSIESRDLVTNEENDRLILAKQYIEDNICKGVSLPELASYCCISEKQLGRIFEHGVGLTVMEYVRKQRCIRIEKMLSDPSLSLRQISEIMNFNNEYYFNAFFKKHAGMTPGAYRKMVANR